MKHVLWRSAAAIVYLIVISSVLITGAAGWLLATRPVLRRRHEP